MRLMALGTGSAVLGALGSTWWVGVVCPKGFWRMKRGRGHLECKNLAETPPCSPLPHPPTLLSSEFLRASAVASCMPAIHTCSSWVFSVWKRCSEVGEITWVGGASAG